jgi:Domain of unknown function (DUF4209)
MGDDPAPERLKVSDTSLDDLNSVILEDLLPPASTAATYHDLERQFDEDIKRSRESGNIPRARVALLIAAVCSFHLQPENLAEPYAPMMQMADGRTPVPGDLSRENIAVLEALVEQVTTPLLKSRIADVLWHLDRSKRHRAHLSVDSYCQAVSALLSAPSPDVDNAELGNVYIEPLLIRAAVISRSIKSPTRMRLTQLAILMREKSALRGRAHDYLRASKILLDEGWQSGAVIAESVERFILTLQNPSPEELNDLWSHTARAYRAAGDPENERKATIEAAEQHVRLADMSGSAMLRAAKLEDAIYQLKTVGGTKERRAVLAAQLEDAQAAVGDEMSTFSQPIDLTDIAESAQAALTGLTLMRALGTFASARKSPDPAELEKSAIKSINANPLQSLFSSVTVDHKGRPIHRSSGAGLGDENRDAIRREISRAESLRRQMVSEGVLRSAWLTIVTEHFVSERALALIVHNSPFVPGDRKHVFVHGFGRFFAGDMISALSVLIPQVENSLRHVLQASGVQATVFNNDRTQEDMSLSRLFSDRSKEIEKIFGAGIAFELEELLLYRGGPNLRHRLAHGQLSASEMFSSDARYVCWLVFRICCIPLFPDWETLEETYLRVQV